MTLGCSAALSACGGGGGGTSQESAASVAVPTCYVQNPNVGKPCIVNDAAVTRGIVQIGDTTRLKALFAKAEQGGTYTIGFIGGSITAGAWSSVPEKNYAHLVTGWFQSKFPKATFIFLDAGVGGTDSHYGDQRLQNDLLQYKPDFVITEWANNDGAQGMAGVAHDYGDVVDRIMGLPNEPAVIMLFTMYRDGNNAEPFETPVGYARNLPMIGMKDAIFAQQQAGDFSGEQRTADSIHPNDLGHLILATLVEQYMDRLR